MSESKVNPEKPKYHMAQCVMWMIGRARHDSKTVLPLAAGRIAAGVMLAVLELFAAPAILDQVEHASSLAGLIGRILFFCVGMMLCGAALGYIDANTLFGRIQVRSAIINDVHVKLCQTSYPNTQDPAYLDWAEKAGDTVTDNRAATEAIWKTLTELAQNTITFGLWLALLAGLHPLLMAVVLVTALIGYYAAQRGNQWYYRHREEEAGYRHQLSYICDRREDVKLAKDVRIFGLAGWIEDLAERSIRLYEDFWNRESRVRLRADLAEVLLVFLRNGAAYIWLLRLVVQRSISASEFLLYFTAVGSLATWVGGILKNLAELNKQSKDISLLREYLEMPEQFRFEDGKAIPRAEDGKYLLELRDVSFRYPGAHRDVLSHVNLTVAPGEKLAVVGLNGAGKTTLVKLLCGFLDPTEGQVLLNGESIRQYNRREYYRMFSSVFQEFSVLAGTVAENVSSQDEAWGTIDQERVWECLEKAGLSEKIRRLPKGIEECLDKKVYDFAVQLSGGEEQRLMLARALYKDGDFLVLDEPTAALDPIAESDLYQKYNEFSAGKTSIYISHRLASTRFCDRIVLLEKEGIAECGTHEELLALGGRYAELFQIQSQYYREGGTGDDGQE